MRLTNKEVIVFCNKVGTLLQSGYEIDKSLYMLKNQFSKKINKITSQIIDNINSGKSISESFKQINIFSNFFISMLTCGETKGNLDDVLFEISNHYIDKENIKTKFITSLLYPTILFISLLISINFLLFFIVPSYENMFLGSEVEISLITKSIINLSIFVRNNYFYIFLGFILFFISVFLVIKSKSYIKSYILFKIPMVNKLFINTKIINFANVFSSLIKSGVNIMNSINLSSEVLDDDFLKERLNLSINSIKEGNSLRYSFEKAQIFPKIFLDMIDIGERSGKLECSLNFIINLYKDELNATLERFSKYMEPTLIFINSIFVILFLLSMTTPIYDSINLI